MNRLFYNRVYLAGPIDFALDFGVGWRQMVQEKLKDIGLIFFDPCHKPMFPGYECPDLEDHARRQELKSRGDWETIASEMRVIRSIDLRLSDLADFSIAHLDLNAYSTGTHEEITNMNRRKIPVLLHMEQGSKAVPDWIRGELPFQHIFSNWEDLFKYIRYIAYEPGQVDALKRWRFFNYGALYGINKIPLTRDQVAKISPEDYNFLRVFSWRANKHGRGYRAVTSYGVGKLQESKYMHQLVAERMGLNLSLEIDHIDGDELNNQRDNLRNATRSEQLMNRIGTAKLGKNIYFDPKRNLFVVDVRGKGKRTTKYLKTLPDAQKVASRLRKELHGKFARD
jgi:hypothetical protein